MKLKVEHCDPNIPLPVATDIKRLVTESLAEIVTDGREFVVNDTTYYRAKRTGGISPCVVNEAEFLSKGFQNNLGSKELCKGETKFGAQSIDGFLRVPYAGKANQIREEALLSILHHLIDKQGVNRTEIYRLFSLFYGMFVRRSMFHLADSLQIADNLSQEMGVETTFKVGVEFETGNIASAFRAINKLSLLYQKEDIDVGVLVTSIDKAGCASRIWPASNRNGSFEELKNREYLNQVGFPLIAIGFAPDRFDRNAGFLAKNGSLYALEATGTRHDSGSFEIFIGHNGEEILHPLAKA